MTSEELNSYDKYLVCFSGGKDSIACFLNLLDLGVPKEKIELHHSLVDGEGETLMDWEITEDYCRKFAAAFNVPIYFNYKVGGFEREMLRNKAKTAPIRFQIGDFTWVEKGGERGKEGTRLKFPQISPDLRTRWCSSYQKVDCQTLAIINDPRFRNIRTLVISGERGEESAARGKYAILEPDRADLRNGKKFQRYVDRWRPVRDWTEKEVWDIICRYKVRAHPCYELGFSRCSCKFCIFGNADQFKTAYAISPVKGEKLIKYEDSFKVTMKRDMDLRTLIEKGDQYPASKDEELVALATSYTYTESIIVEGEWKLPAGAFKMGCGPT